MYEDKTLVCKECGKEFVFTAGEQEFYAERGFQNGPPALQGLPRRAQERCPWSPRVFHRCLRCLRRRGQGALRFPRAIVLCTAATASPRCVRTADLLTAHC